VRDGFSDYGNILPDLTDGANTTGLRSASQCGEGFLRGEWLRRGSTLVDDFAPGDNSSQEFSLSLVVWDGEDVQAKDPLVKPSSRLGRSPVTQY
jgi:hypothetical protein